MKREDSRGKRRLGLSGCRCLRRPRDGAVQRGRGLSGLLWQPLPEEDIRDIVRVSVEGGVDWFDTAELYGRGESEAALSRALAELGIKRESVVIADKWWPLLRTAGSIRRR